MADPLDQYEPIFQAASQEWSIDPQLLKALAAQESRGNPNAVSPAGALGLTQLMPDTARTLGVTNPFDPAQAIYGAAKYLSQARDAEGDNPQRALLYYHGGPNWRQNYGPESAAYVPGVAAHYQQYAKASTNTATDATPAPAPAQPMAPGAGPGAAGDKVAQSDQPDDPFTQALKAAPAPAEAPSGGTDPFTAALGQPGASTEVPKQEAPQSTPAAVGVGGGPAESAADTVKRLLHIGAAPPPSSPLADAITSPDAAAADQPAGATPPSSQDIRNALQPAPNTTYGEVLPLARDNATGQIRLALPNIIRQPLLGVAEGVGGLTINPATGTYGLTPEAQAAATMGASPLRFGMGERVAPGIIDTTQAPPLTGVNPLSREATARANVRAAAAPPDPAAPAAPATPAPSTPVPPQYTAPAAEVATAAGASGPQSVGAAASRDLSAPGTFALTPEEIAAYRSTAEGQKLLENQQPGIADRNAYVPGVTPNAAEQEQTVAMARELKSLGIASTEVSQEAREAAAANNEARRQYLQDTVKSPVDLMRAEADRQAQAEADLKATWANKAEADASPVVDTINAIQASPDWKRGAVRNAVNSVNDALRDADGKLETDPEQLYGVRKHIDDLLSKEGQRETPLSARATANLQAIKGQLDDTIEAAAPGFKQYLQNFSTASRGIDEMRVLQDLEPKLYDSQGRMQYNNFQRAMKNIVDMRGAQGINGYKSISDDTMQRLWNLRDDLRRSATAMDLARAPGSDTTGNFVDLVKQYGKLGGAAAVQGVANLISPGWGSVVVGGMQRAAAPFRAARLARRQTQRAQQLLRPTNPLQYPQAAP